jgi:hypothetical protein
VGEIEEGVTEVGITLSVQQLQTHLLVRGGTNPLVESYRRIQRQETLAEEVKNNRVRDLVLKRFAGRLPSLPPLQEFLFSSLNLPQAIPVSFYYRGGVPVFFECHLASAILRVGPPVMGSKQIRALKREGNSLVYQSYNKDLLDVFYGMIQIFPQERQLVNVEVRQPFDSYPIIFIDVFAIEEGPVYLSQKRGFSRINAGDQDQRYSREAILRYTLPPMPVSDQPGATDETPRPSAIATVARAQERRSPALIIEKRADGGEAPPGDRRSLERAAKDLGVAWRTREMIALSLARTILEEVDRQPTAKRWLLALRFILGI